MLKNSSFFLLLFLVFQAKNDSLDTFKLQRAFSFHFQSACDPEINHATIERNRNSVLSNTGYDPSNVIQNSGIPYITFENRTIMANYTFPKGEFRNVQT